MDTQGPATEKTKTKDMLQSIYATVPGMSDKDIQASSYVLEKTYRIVSVTLRLANLMDTNDALREEIQKTSMSLVKDSAYYPHAHTARISFSNASATLTALLETAVLTGKLARSNVDMIENELSDLLHTLRSLELSSGRSFLGEYSFGGDAPLALFEPEPFKDRTRTPERHYTEARRPTQAPAPVPYARDLMRERKDTTDAPLSTKAERQQSAQKDRRAVILGLLQKRDRINVKDVSAVVKDCSEKTIQRELLALVAQGVLKKEGERRWSTYTLV